MTIAYRQIRGLPPGQQDAVLAGNRVLQADELASVIDAEPPLIIGVADGVAATPKAERMSLRLLEQICGAYVQEGMAFNAKLIRRAQETLTRGAQADGLVPESASTVVLAEIKNGYVTVLNTGDSRAYLINKVTGAHRRLSKDHTTFELLKDNGEIPADAQECDYGSIATGLLEAITATPMGDQDFAVHMGYARLTENEVVLLCSDGVTTHLQDVEIAEAVVSAESVDGDTCAHIIDLVIDQGAQDNTTVVIMDAGFQETRKKE